VPAAPKQGVQNVHTLVVGSGRTSNERWTGSLGALHGLHSLHCPVGDLVGAADAVNPGHDVVFGILDALRSIWVQG
jgi:hypothetical protein